MLLGGIAFLISGNRFDEFVRIEADGSFGARLEFGLDPSVSD